MQGIAKSLTGKLNLYDHIGYLLVGAVGLLLIALDLWLIKSPVLAPVFGWENALVWLVVTYFLGHLVQAIANLVIKEDKASYSDSDKAILADARDYFEHPELTDSEAFLHCYMLACAKDITGHVTAFNAYYSLYRGWLVLFAAQTGFFVVFFFMNWLTWTLVIPTLGSLAITLLFSNRRKRFWKYLGAKALQTFVILRKLTE